MAQPKIMALSEEAQRARDSYLTEVFANMDLAKENTSYNEGVISANYKYKYRLTFVVEQISDEEYEEIKAQKAQEVNNILNK